MITDVGWRKKSGNSRILKKCQTRENYTIEVKIATGVTIILRYLFPQNFTYDVLDSGCKPSGDTASGGEHVELSKPFRRCRSSTKENVVQRKPIDMKLHWPWSFSAQWWITCLHSLIFQRLSRMENQRGPSYPTLNYGRQTYEELVWSILRGRFLRTVWKGSAITKGSEVQHLICYRGLHNSLQPQNIASQQPYLFGGCWMRCAVWARVRVLNWSERRQRGDDAVSKQRRIPAPSTHKKNVPIKHDDCLKWGARQSQCHSAST